MAGIFAGLPMGGTTLRLIDSVAQRRALYEDALFAVDTSTTVDAEAQFATSHALTVAGGVVLVGAAPMGATATLTSSASHAPMAAVAMSSSAALASAGDRTSPALADLAIAYDLDALGALEHDAAVSMSVTADLATFVSVGADALLEAGIDLVAGALYVHAGIAALEASLVLTATADSDSPPGITATLVAASTLEASLGVATPGTFFNPLPITDPSPQAVDFAEGADTVEPAAVRGDALSSDLWFDITAASTSTLTLTWTGAFAVGLELWAAPEGEAITSVEDVTLLADAAGPVLEYAAGQGQRYLIRVYPLDDANNAGTGSLAWAFTARPDGLLELMVEPISYDAYDWLRASILSATPEGYVELYVDGDLVDVVVVDDSGMVVGFTVPIGDLTPGLHTLMAHDVPTGQESAKEFEVVIFTVGGDVDPTPVGPTSPASSDPVIRWIFEKVLPSPSPGEIYTFPNNPSSMSTPHAPRVISAEHTSAPDGQPILWEGLGAPVEWVVEGFCFEQAHADALEYWHSQNRRFWAVDHLQRAWAVTFEALDWTTVRDSKHPWAARYRIKLFIYDGPVMLT